MVFFQSTLFCSLTLLAYVASALTTNSTILVFARTQALSYSATSGLNAYGIPYQLVIVPQEGITLPTLTSADNSTGNYGGFILLSEVAYNYSNVWHSALTNDQFNQIYAYQSRFGARMVRLDVFPGPAYGSTVQIAGTGCCSAGEEQLVSISDNSRFPTANIKTGATMSTQGLYHYPAVITDGNTTVEIARFEPSSKGTFSKSSTAAVINTFGQRQQMVWFMSWATDWSPTSNFLQHAYVNWLTRGLFAGRRRLYFSTQIDDVHLVTDIYYPKGAQFRLRPDDLAAHVPWTQSINSRMPPGSNYFIELGHNGNGDVQQAVAIQDAANLDVLPCNPDTGIEYGDVSAPPLEWQKPLGTGVDNWPASPPNFAWSMNCTQLDPLASWFLNQTNLNAYAHVSHTFAHSNLNNATYSDVNREISFNIAWLKQMGIDQAQRFSSKSLIPPAITGLHNGDALQAWSDNGITTCVGDNTRPVLMNPYNEYWPQISNISTNGFAGINIVPRWATTIYYNCDFANCTTEEWIKTSAGKGGFSDLLVNAVQVNSRHLLGLHQDPYMFHQANMRYIDTDTFTVGDQTGKMSLLMVWVETIVKEMNRLTTWPLLTLKHDDIGVAFLNRMALDKCQPTLQWTYDNSNSSITGVTIGTANGNTCSVPVPVTFPGTASTTAAGTTNEQIGTDPLTIWATLNGSPVTFQLGSPIPLIA